MTTLTAAVIICTRNRLDPMLTCLDSLAKQTFPICQLIVVDSGQPSLDKQKQFTILFSTDRFPETELIYLHTQPGLTYQRNQGIARAESDVVFFFDDDTVLSSDYIAILMEAFQNHPEYGGGMGRIAGIPPARRRPGDYLRRFFLLTHSASDGRMQNSGFPGHSHGRLEFMDVEILSGGLTAYRSCILREFAFDDGVTGYSYMEDVDFSYRVSRRYKLFYDPRAVIQHNHSPLARDKISANRKMLLVNHHYFFFKNIYPNCRWCFFHYLWAVMGLFVFAILNANWRMVYGYSLGASELVHRRFMIWSNEH